MSFSFWKEALRSVNCSLASGRNAEVVVRATDNKNDSEQRRAVIHDAMRSQRLLRTLSISLKVSASTLENERTAVLGAVI